MNERKKYNIIPKRNSSFHATPHNDFCSHVEEKIQNNNASWNNILMTSFFGLRLMNTFFSRLFNEMSMRLYMN